MLGKFGYKKILKQIEENPGATTWNLRAIQAAVREGRITPEEENKLRVKLKNPEQTPEWVGAVQGKLVECESFFKSGKFIGRAMYSKELSQLFIKYEIGGFANFCFYDLPIPKEINGVRDWTDTLSSEMYRDVSMMTRGNDPYVNDWLKVMQKKYALIYKTLGNNKNSAIEAMYEGLRFMWKLSTVQLIPFYTQEEITWSKMNEIEINHMLNEKFPDVYVEIINKHFLYVFLTSEPSHRPSYNISDEMKYWIKHSTPDYLRALFMDIKSQPGSSWEPGEREERLNEISKDIEKTHEWKDIICSAEERNFLNKELMEKSSFSKNFREVLLCFARMRTRLSARRINDLRSYETDKLSKFEKRLNISEFETSINKQIFNYDIVVLFNSKYVSNNSEHTTHSLWGSIEFNGSFRKIKEGVIGIICLANNKVLFDEVIQLMLLSTEKSPELRVPVFTPNCKLLWPK